MLNVPSCASRLNRHFLERLTKPLKCYLNYSNHFGGIMSSFFNFVKLPNSTQKL